MKRRVIVVFVLFGLSIAGLASARVTPSEDDSSILKFKTMAPVTGPYVGPTNPIRDVPGGNLPWIISRGWGHLKENGGLEVHVRGLVLPSPPFNFTNPVPNFRAIVSCQSIDAAGGASVVNISTGDFPASVQGDSDIETVISLAQPCIAPIIFVTHPAGRWFAATGN